MVRARAVSGKRPRESDSEDFDPQAGSDYDSGGDSFGIPVPPRGTTSRRTGGPPAALPPLPDDDDDDDGAAIEAQLGNSLISLGGTGGAFGNVASAVAFATSQAAAADAAKPKLPGERKKIQITYLADKNRRHITFAKRKAGILKKAYELSTLTGTQVLLLVVSETGVVYTYTTPKLRPIVQDDRGKNLIQACLANAANSADAFSAGKHVQGGVVTLKASMPGAPTRGGSHPGRPSKPKQRSTSAGSSKGKGRKGKSTDTPPLPPLPLPPAEGGPMMLPPMDVGLPPHLLHGGAQLVGDGASSMYQSPDDYLPTGSDVQPWTHAQ